MNQVDLESPLSVDIGTFLDYAKNKVLNMKYFIICWYYRQVQYLVKNCAVSIETYWMSSSTHTKFV